METESEVNLKRPHDQRDGPPSKRRNTGNVLDLRRTRNRNNLSAVGTLTDPLNLNNASQEGMSTNDRKRRFDEAPGAIYQRRMSFRQVKRRGEHLPSVSEEPTFSSEAQKAKKEMMNKRYRYGNFNYHFKMPFQTDPRIDLLVEDWFKGKNVLDLGCNSGVFTLSIAMIFNPHRILGIDIDPHLIGAARKNIRHFNDKNSKIIGRFPASFALNFGPTSTLSPTSDSEFPNNVWFRQENYVFETDEELESVKEEFDTIVAFSLTKWVHLNWGDFGLMRLFKRVYRQLKPGGRFILEPQSSRGYKSKAKTLPEMETNYKSIKLWPDNFAKFLLSIGFVHYEALDTPLVRALDCDAPILLFYKGPMAGWENTPVENVPIPQREPVAEFNDFNYTCTPRADGSQTSSTPREDPQTPSYD